MFVELSKIAKVSLGYKSLQNNFYYVNAATISSFGIEERFLTPILKLRDLSGIKYIQSPNAKTWLFNCKEEPNDLRGTGALRYIEAMADKAAAEKKQGVKSKTIREVLSAQSGSLWYAPKAKPSFHTIWVRKAIDGVFAPFIFDSPRLVDQRLNSVEPIGGIKADELASVLTSSLFAFSVEVNGANSMGAGALEASTKSLRRFPVLNLAALDEPARRQLVRLAEEVWKAEVPIDWSANPAPQIGPHMRALDQWILNAAGKDIALDKLYSDLFEASGSRIRVAKDKNKKSKAKHSMSIGGVAAGISKSIRKQVLTKNFPEDFVVDMNLDLSFQVDRASLRRIEMSNLLGSVDIVLKNSAGDRIYSGNHPSSVAEGIVRSLLWGRSAFKLSSNDAVMHRAVEEFLSWARAIDTSISEAVASSAFGTGYEDELKRDIFKQLGLSPVALAKVLPNEVTLVADESISKSKRNRLKVSK